MQLPTSIPPATSDGTETDPTRRYRCRHATIFSLAKPPVYAVRSGANQYPYASNASPTNIGIVPAR